MQAKAAVEARLWRHCCQAQYASRLSGVSQSRYAEAPFIPVVLASVTPGPYLMAAAYVLSGPIRPIDCLGMRIATSYLEFLPVGDSRAKQHAPPVPVSGSELFESYRFCLRSVIRVDKADRAARSK